MKTLRVATTLVIATLMAGCSRESAPPSAAPQATAETAPGSAQRTQAQRPSAEALPPSTPPAQPTLQAQRAQAAPKKQSPRDGEWVGEGENLTIHFVVARGGAVVRDLGVSTRGLQLTGAEERMLLSRGATEGMVSSRGTSYPGVYPIIESKFALPGSGVAGTFLSSSNAEGTAENRQWKGRILAPTTDPPVDAAADTKECLANLRRLDEAKRRWTADTKKAVGDTPFATHIIDYLADRSMPKCPAGGDYKLNPVGQKPQCSVHGSSF